MGRTGVPPNAKSLANLRPPKKGEVRNPNGTNGGPLMMKLRRMSSDEIVEVGTLILDKNAKGLQDIIDDARGPDKKGNPNSKHSALKVWLATIAMKGISRGDAHALDMILNRIIGKVKEKVEVTGEDGSAIKTLVGAMTPEERMAEIMRLRKIREDAGGS